MPSPDTIDIDRLIDAIPGDAPAGVDPATDAAPDSPYTLGKDARAAARNREKSSSFEGMTPDRDDAWRKVREHCVALLETTGKSMEVATWLTESLVRLEGLAGLRDGLRLMHGLVERLWDDLHPQPNDADEDGTPDNRVNPIAVLSRRSAESMTLPSLLQWIPLGERCGTALSLARLDQARRLESAGTDEDRVSIRNQGGRDLSELKELASRSSDDWIAEFRDDLRETQTCLATFEDVIRRKAAPTRDCSFEDIKQVLQRFEPAISELYGDRATDAAPSRDDLAPESTGTAAGPAEAIGRDIAASSTNPTSGAAARMEMIGRLSEVAAWFRREEPHSAFGWALDQWVQWGKMQYPELRNDNAFTTVCNTMFGSDKNDGDQETPRT